MTQPQTSTEAIAARVRHLMKRKDWTAQDLVDALAAVGVEWTRLIVANLLVKKPDRRRRYVTVDELLALAYILDVAPVHLLVPPLPARFASDVPGGQNEPNDHASYAVTPTVDAPVFRVRDFVRGRRPLDGMDAWTFYAEWPAHERPGSAELERLVGHSHTDHTEAADDGQR